MEQKIGRDVGKKKKSEAKEKKKFQKCRYLGCQTRVWRHLKKYTQEKKKQNKPKKKHRRDVIIPCHQSKS